MSVQLLEALDLADEAHPSFYARVQDLDRHTPPLPYAHAVPLSADRSNGGSEMIATTRSVTDRLLEPASDERPIRARRCEIQRLPPKILCPMVGSPIIFPLETKRVGDQNFHPNDVVKLKSFVLASAAVGSLSKASVTPMLT